MRYCQSGEKSKSAILDLTICRSDLTWEFESLVTFLTEILVQTPYIYHGFQVKFFQARKKLFCSLISFLSCFPRQFSIWTEQKVPSQYLSQPAHCILDQLVSYEQPLSLKIYALQAVCFTLLNLHFLYNSSTLYLKKLCLELTCVYLFLYYCLWANTKQGSEQGLGTKYFGQFMIFITYIIKFKHLKFRTFTRWRPNLTPMG